MKYKLLKDLPFAKAGEVVELKGDDNCRDGSTWIVKDGTILMKWYSEWGDPRESGWFEEVKENRYRAERLMCYFYLNETGNIQQDLEEFMDEDNYLFNSGNYFKNLVQATEAQTEFHALLTKLHQKWGE